jgi:hypothetical protein
VNSEEILPGPNDYFAAIFHLEAFNVLISASSDNLE